MESGYFSACNESSAGCNLHGLQNVEEVEEMKMVPSLPAIPQPQTLQEPMEFLSRSWSPSPSEISKALAQKQKQKQFFLERSPETFPEATSVPQLTGKIIKSGNTRKTGSIRKWFHHKEFTSSKVWKKDKEEVERARVHSAVSIAGVASALAAITAAENSTSSGSKTTMASATELLASHCIEMAELAGADHDRVASAVRSAVDIQSPGDLMTLTAAAATALRGESALKSRLPKEARKNAAIRPYDRGMAEIPSAGAFYSQVEEQDPPCVGELLQLTGKGVFQWKRVSVYINNKSQVIIKLKHKHVGGAFSKKNKSVVYGVCDETSAWPYKKEREMSEEVYFGLKTGQGLLEFKCKNKVHKQKWVDGIKNLLRRVSYIDETEQSLGFLKPLIMQYTSVKSKKIYTKDLKH